MWSQVCFFVVIPRGEKNVYAVSNCISWHTGSVSRQIVNFFGWAAHEARIYTTFTIFWLWKTLKQVLLDERWSIFKSWKRIKKWKQNILDFGVAFGGVFLLYLQKLSAIFLPSGPNNTHWKTGCVYAVFPCLWTAVITNAANKCEGCICFWDRLGNG